ncbi:MAG: caspase family protein [Bacteroidetes bacterium]|nr:caspase family protein [Bacteroidota bacterium]
MKKWKSYLVVVALLVAGSVIFAQTAEKSSGTVKLNMKKEKPRANDTPQPKTNEFSKSTNLRMSKPLQVSPDTPGSFGISWVSPAFTSVQTAEDSYLIMGTVNSNENIRFINLFVNGQFVKNIIPPVPTIKQMEIDEQMPLALGANLVKVEVVTVSGKKIESILDIVYDISTARYIALVIAVEQYDDPGINDLDHPISDAERFIDVIESEYNFHKENIIFLKNPSKAEIIGRLHAMRKQVTNEDNLLIYYAGHGQYDDQMETGYWFPRDAREENPVDWLPNTDLTNYLNVLKTKHTLLIADACFSGGIFKSRAAFNNAMAVEKMYKLNSRKALTSGSLNEEVPDKSVFIDMLIKRLKHNTQKYLPAEQLYTSIKPAVMNNTNTMPKYGTIQNVGDEGGDFIFIRKD